MSVPVGVPDDLYKVLVEVAARQGQSVEDLVASVLREGVAELEVAEQRTEASATYARASDPLMRFSGIGASDDPSWIDEHDRHLAEFAAGELADADERTPSSPGFHASLAALPQPSAFERLRAAW